MERVTRTLFRFFVPLNRFAYERTGGRVGGRLRGAPVLLLSTTGRKTGKRRTTPLLYLVDDDGLVVVASAGGASKHPAWFLNLCSNPEVDVQMGSEHRPMLASETSGDQRTRLWAKLVDMYPSYDAYQRRTTREIPVVVLSGRPAG